MSTMANSTGIWTDRFVQPAETDLLGAMNKPERALVERLIERCGELGLNARTVKWQGIPWRWTLQLSMRSGGPVLFIIPRPDRPQVAVPLGASDLDRIPMRRLSKAVREGVLGARAVASTLWPEWDLTSNTQIDELMTLIRVRTESVGAASA
jgi:hypothetical protein